MAINITLLKDGKSDMIRKFELLVVALKEQQEVENRNKQIKIKLKKIS